MKNRSPWRQRLGAAVLAALLGQAAEAVPLVSGTLAPPLANAGSNVTLDVLVSGAVGLYAYQFSLAFNPAQLQITSVAEGTFLPSGGSTFFGGGTIDNTAGTLLLSFDSLIGNVPGKTGSGLLERIVFRVVGAGSSAIQYSDLAFIDSNFSDLGAQSLPTSVTTLPVPEPASAVLLAAGLAALGLARRRVLRAAPRSFG